jgi:hypothetical protein
LKELIELESRIVRLRARLRNGDSDVTSDEIEAVIVRAEANRDELMGVEFDPKGSAINSFALRKARRGRS